MRDRFEFKTYITTVRFLYGKISNTFYTSIIGNTIPYDC